MCVCVTRIPQQRIPRPEDVPPHRAAEKSESEAEPHKQWNLSDAKWKNCGKIITLRIMGKVEPLGFHITTVSTSKRCKGQVTMQLVASFDRFSLGGKGWSKRRVAKQNHAECGFFTVDISCE